MPPPPPPSGRGCRRVEGSRPSPPARTLGAAAALFRVRAGRRRGRSPVGHSARAAGRAHHPHEPEHRRVTVAFIHYDGTDRLISEQGPEEAARQLDVLVTHVQGAADRQGVTFLATDADRDGGKIILTAGAPSSSGDDEHRMLLALREIMDAENPLPIRIGVNQGSVFVGEVGPHYRRTFTVMGDAVNLAARLMAKAEPGEILTTPDLLARSRTGFESTELEPFLVKGKAKPVRAVRLGAKTREGAAGTHDELPLVGRRRELQQLEEIAAEAVAGHGTLVEIVGATGVENRRVAGRLRETTTDRMQLFAICERYDSSTPYFTVRRLSAASSGYRLKEVTAASRRLCSPSWRAWPPISSRGPRSSAWRSPFRFPRLRRRRSSKRSSGARSWPSPSSPCWPCSCRSPDSSPLRMSTSWTRRQRISSGTSLGSST